MDEIEKFFLPIVRNKLPTLIGGEISPEFPISEPAKDFKTIKKLFFEICFEGGPYHDFIKGFGFRPYKKVFKISIKTIRFYEEGIYHSTTEKTLFKKIVKEYTEKEYWETKRKTSTC